MWLFMSHLKEGKGKVEVIESMADASTSATARE